MIKLLSSTKEETQEKYVSSLPGIFHYKKDLRESIIAIKTLSAVMKLLKSESQNLLVASLSCLAALFLSIRENQDMALIARDALSPLIILANSPALEVAENTICALANLLLDDIVSISAVLEEIILPSTRVLSDGTTLGKTQAAAAIAHLLHSRAATDGLTDCINRVGTVLSLISLLEIANDGSPAKSEALDALAFLSRLGVSSGKAQARGPLGFKALPKQKHWLATIMRSRPILVKIHGASVLGSLCKENELRVKVLLGGCIPPLLGLLRSNSSDGQIAAAKTIYAVSQGNARDHVGSKIFSTEGVVLVLWKQLDRGHRGGNVVDELMTGALKNLSTNTEGFWPATMRAGGMDILVKLLASGESGTQANVCFFIACVMMEDASVCPTVLEGGVIKLLLKLLVPSMEGSIIIQL